MVLLGWKMRGVKFKAVIKWSAFPHQPSSGSNSRFWNDDFQLDQERQMAGAVDFLRTFATPIRTPKKTANSTSTNNTTLSTWR